MAGKTAVLTREPVVSATVSHEDHMRAEHLASTGGAAVLLP